MRAKIFVLPLILILALVSVSAWNQCNNTITTSGKYTLNESLTCTGYTVNIDNYNFRINTSNVEIDCAGYTLTSNVSDGWIDTFFVRGSIPVPARSNITIRNCNLIQIGQTQLEALNNYYDNYWSLINNNITSDTAHGGLMRIVHYAGDSMPKFHTITGNRFYLSGGAANSAFMDIMGGVNCSSGVKIYNNYFSVDATHFIFHNRDICEFAYANGTGGIGNYYADTRYNCTDGNLDGICDSPYAVYRNASGYYPVRDYYATSQYPYNCSPLWACSGYATCNGSANVSCNSVTDTHSCIGTPAYSGNYSEFTPQNCSYNCTPSWTCGGYGACNITDNALCNIATDMNTCNISYAGNYSEFSPQPCNYCSANVATYNATGCVANTSTTCYINNNYASCCGVTALPSDCPQNASIVCTTENCSIGDFDYDASDIAPVTIDGIAKLIITIARVGFLIFMIGFVVWALAKLGIEKLRGRK